MRSEADNRYILREGGWSKKQKRHRPETISIVRKVAAKPSETHLIYVEDVDGCRMRKVNPKALIPYTRDLYEEMTRPPEEEDSFEDILSF